MDKLDRQGTISVNGKFLRKDDPLIAGCWIDGVKDALGGQGKIAAAGDDTLMEVIVDFIRLLLKRMRQPQAAKADDKSVDEALF